MKIFSRGAMAVLAVVLFSGVAQAAVKVELSGLHICCGACVSGIQKAAKGIEGTKIEVDKDAATCTIEADDLKAAQKVVDAIAAAGYHGDSDTKGVSMKDDSKAPKGKVNRIIVKGAHNCCRGCSNAIRDVVKDVEGVQASTVEPRGTSFVVEGDFEAVALVKALNDNGFHVTVTR